MSLPASAPETLLQDRSLDTLARQKGMEFCGIISYVRRYMGDEEALVISKLLKKRAAGLVGNFENMTGLLRDLAIYANGFDESHPFIHRLLVYELVSMASQMLNKYTEEDLYELSEDVYIKTRIRIWNHEIQHLIGNLPVAMSTLKKVVTGKSNLDTDLLTSLETANSIYSTPLAESNITERLNLVSRDKRGVFFKNLERVKRNLEELKNAIPQILDRIDELNIMTPDKPLQLAGLIEQSKELVSGEVYASEGFIPRISIRYQDFQGNTIDPEDVIVWGSYIDIKLILTELMRNAFLRAYTESLDIIVTKTRIGISVQMRNSLNTPIDPDKLHYFQQLISLVNQCQSPDEAYYKSREWKKQFQKAFQTSTTRTNGIPGTVLLLHRIGAQLKIDNVPVYHPNNKLEYSQITINFPPTSEI